MAEIVFFDHKVRQNLQNVQPVLRCVPDTPHIALIGNFPPRRCGIATFTCDTRDALLMAEPAMTVDVYAMDDGAKGMLPAGLRYINQDESASYTNAAQRINNSGAKLAWLQHEFGIFGGNDGEMVLALIEAIEVPVVITLHTLLEKPSANQRRIMDALIRKASMLIVMAQKGREILQRCYDSDPKLISVIPHGIPDLPYVEPVEAKFKAGFEGREVILTFGLLSPEKGIGDMIEAMPRIVANCPNALYVVLGATHPNVIKHNGEALREALQTRAMQLGVQNHVLLIDAFVDLKLLTEYLQAADVYVTPYHNPDQITSGTLSYAVGLGKPVVSTCYVHAQELLSGGIGVLVPFQDPDSLANAIINLLDDHDDRAAMANRAYQAGRTMTWPRYAKAAISAFIPVISAQSERANVINITSLPVVGIAALERMSDDTGMFQHSRFGVADRNHGYCIDDNARALALMSLSADIPAPLHTKLSHCYAAFIQHAWNPDIGVFRNFMHFERRWLEDAGSADSNGRTLWALSLAACRHSDPLIREWANELYRESQPRIMVSCSPRALAFSVLAAAEMETNGQGQKNNLETIRAGASDLLAKLDLVRRADWIWFEQGLAYDNCRLPEALLHASKLLNDKVMLAKALEAMDWILRLQKSSEGWFRPVGSDSFHSQPFAQPVAFDQQPVEALAAIEGCIAAMIYDPHQKWTDYGQAAYAWFLGANDLQLVLADNVSGECSDGLTREGVNANRGAESVLAWQMASRQILRLRTMSVTREGVLAKA